MIKNSVFTPQKRGCGQNCGALCVPKVPHPPTGPYHHCNPSSATATNRPVLQDKINTSQGKPDKIGENDTYAKTNLSQNPITFRGQWKVLGVIWDIESDNFFYDFNHLSAAILATEPTKRQIVSVTGRFYDPLGIIQPVIVTFKIFIQELCRVGITWDEPPSRGFIREVAIAGGKPLQFPTNYNSQVLC